MSNWWDGIGPDDPRFPYRGIEPLTKDWQGQAPFDLQPGDHVRTSGGIAVVIEVSSPTDISASRNCDLNEVATPGRKAP